MKPLVVVAACVVALACSSSKPQAETANVTPPELLFVQLVGPDQLNWPQGVLEVQYGVRIRNKADETITLRQIQIESVGDGGPYFVARSRYFFKFSVKPDNTDDVTFWAKAYSEGNRYRIDAQAPVTIRGIAFFETPIGRFRKPFVTNLSQAWGDMQ
ncbi:MAG: hypothetical protein ACLGH0_08665 [Thermoanaerobaculia bacterium]